MKYLSLLLLAVLVALAAANPPEPEVDTKGGKLRGKWSKSDSGRPVASFEGVPYAKPPVGALRFSPPVPMEPWSDVRVADAPGSMCLQRNIFLGEEKLEGSEDCLYLNVYAPETLSREKPVPVMVFVHGGGFLCGSGSLYTHEYLTDRDVVLVTFNYRLGPLGFLSTADSVVPGNIGMKDMVLVLHWVQDNIRAFGGDPSKVTIFGESAGGASVHMLVLSPLSKGLFHRAIPMSGNALAPWAFQEAATSRTKTNKIAKSLGCPTESSEQLKQCLMGKSAEDIQGTDKLLMEWMVHPMVPFRPTAEPSGPGAFLDRHPKHMYEAGLAADVPFMTGFTTNEGCLGAVPIIENPSSLEDFDRNFNRIAPIVFMRSQLPTDVSKEIFDKIRKFYFDDKAIGKENKWQMIDVFTDCFFTHSCLETVKLQKKAAKSQLFMYQLAHTSNRSWAVPFGAKDASYGVCHADDLLYLFPLSFVSPGGRSTEDKAFSKHLVELFTTFAETGRPTADGSWQEVQNPERAEYMYLSEVGSCSMRQDYENKRMNMWYQLPVNVAQAEGPSTPAVLAETCPRGSSCQLDGL